jgi:DNA-directed RNA polymerase specialized sigma24 family protein
VPPHSGAVIGRATGDRRAVADLEQVYRDNGPRLWRSVLAYCGDRWIADDAVAEAFAQAIRRGEGLRTPERWVWTAAFKIAAGALKERRQTEALATEGGSPDPEPPWDLIDALAELPDRQRASVVLHHYAGYSAFEIARMLGSTPPAIRMHLTRGRRRLRAALEGGDDGE